MEADKPKELEPRQAHFVKRYCAHFNATKAAKEAGYSPDSCRQIGSENLSKPYIKEAIKKRLDEVSMTAEEAVMRLTDWGRGSFKPFTSENAEFGLVLDLKKRTAKRNLHLIRKIKQTKKIFYNALSDNSTTEYLTEIELHDAKDAVDKIAKIRGLYIDKGDSGVTVHLHFDQDDEKL